MDIMLFSLLLDFLLDAVARCEKLKVFQGDLFLASEVPFDEVLELTLHKLETASLDQLSKLINRNFLCLLMLDSIKESLQETIILLLISQLLFCLWIECAHQLTELLFSDFLTVWLICVLREILNKGVIESLLSLSVVLFINDRSRQ